MGVCPQNDFTKVLLQRFKAPLLILCAIVHVVLSTLYQEKMVTEQEVEELKPLAWPWDHLVCIQCTKPPDVVKRTAELLAEVGRDEEGKQLKGQ